MENQSESCNIDITAVIEDIGDTATHQIPSSDFVPEV